MLLYRQTTVWLNPLSTDPEVRTSTLAQAFYRAQQDARTAVRYLRMSAAEMCNPYGIGKFAIVGTVLVVTWH